MPCACSATRLARRAEPQIHSLRVLARLSAVSSRVAPLVRRAVCVRRGKAARTRMGGRGGGHAPPGVLTRCGRRFWRVVKPGAVDRWSWSVGGGVVMSFRNSDSSRRAVGVARRWGPRRYGRFGPAGGRVAWRRVESGNRP
jgi:hypothetical protein